RPDLTRKLYRVKHPRSLPTVLSREEVTRMLGATTSLKHQAILSVAYGAGLRASEVAKLRVSDVDGERMLLRVECGKGGGHRNAMLPKDLLHLLRAWWKEGRDQGIMHRDGWLFSSCRTQGRLDSFEPTFRCLNAWGRSLHVPCCLRARRSITFQANICANSLRSADSMAWFTAAR
ncbi:MAG TPA: tyrosine-type recombinase/integrase, partial [Sphingobium sp.]|uniref:tyrosine-type recombinase/integrase n=1 Tax=Sphingobium sp. TaxID=1912891 RepID=UPI002ED2A303